MTWSKAPRLARTLSADHRSQQDKALERVNTNQRRLRRCAAVSALQWLHANASTCSGEPRQRLCVSDLSDHALGLELLRLDAKRSVDTAVLHSQERAFVVCALHLLCAVHTSVKSISDLALSNLLRFDQSSLSTPVPMAPATSDSAAISPVSTAPATCKTWFITGCSSGIGRELALAALAHGDAVIATARNVSKLDDLQLRGATTLALDATWLDERVAQVVADAISVHGRIDILVNNAGYSLQGAIEECRCARMLHAVVCLSRVYELPAE